MKEQRKKHGKGIMRVYSTLPDDQSEESSVESPSEPISIEMITKVISGMNSGKAAVPSGIVSETLKLVWGAGIVKVHDFVEVDISERHIPMTGGGATLSFVREQRGSSKQRQLQTLRIVLSGEGVFHENLSDIEPLPWERKTS